VLFLLRGFGYQQVEGVDLSAECVRQAGASPRRDSVRRGGISTRGRAGLSPDHAFDLLEHLGKDELLDLLQAVYARSRPAESLIAQVPMRLPWGLQVRYGDLTHELAFDRLACARSFRWRLRGI